MSALSIIADDKRIIGYRPNFTKLTGSVTSAILLQQMIFWWDKMSGECFYKFKEPCSHKQYKPKQSWCEELSFTRSEFDLAIEKIGTKITEGKSKANSLAWELPRLEDFPDDPNGYNAAFNIAVEHLVVYWTDSNRLTWYQVNGAMLDEAIIVLYSLKQIPALPRKVGFQLYLEKADSSFTYITKTIPETTTDSANADDDSDSKKNSKSKEKSPRPPQPHMAPIVAFVEAVGKDTLPPAFDYGALSSLSKKMHESGVTPEQMTLSGQLVRAWIDHSQTRIALDWTVAEITVLTRRAYSLASANVTPAAVGDFMDTTYQDDFWRGKVIGFKYIVDHICANDTAPTTPVSGDSEMVDDPERPGVQITRTQLAKRDAARILYEQSQQ